MISIALAGNPNSGKTTLFNRLTGTRQTTGNWPGVTVEKKAGQIHHRHKTMMLVDLPGIYSLLPYSMEEIVTRNHILEDKPDVVVNIIDATNLERNLYLTLQLSKLGRPMVIALNMMDELSGHGDTLDVGKLETLLNIPVIPISAKKNEGIQDLLDAVQKLLDQQEGQIPTPGQVSFEPESEAETEAMYHQAAKIHDQVLVHSHGPGALTRSDKIDRFLTNRWLAIPVFLLVMFLVFQVTFHEQLGGRLTGWLDVFFSKTFSGLVSQWLSLAQAPAWIRSLLVDGIIAGVGGVLTFLPQIALLFFSLTILEDTGYMARAAFIMDRLFQKLGLSGRSFIPMIMGFGCTVPAVMATRTLGNDRDRRITIMITPFMSCGARMPIYAFFASVFFVKNKGLVTFSMYLLGIVMALISALILSRTVKKKQDSPFLIELPPYRMPDGESLFLHVWDKVKDFITRAGTLIFVMTIVVWFFQTRSFTLQPVQDSANSIFGQLGNLLAPLFKPLGFGNWKATVALLTGLVAKESVVASLKILYAPGQLQQVFTPLSAYAFMTFTLLYTPCIAALGAIRREMRSWQWTLASVAWQTATAWLMAFLVYQGGNLL